MYLSIQNEAIFVADSHYNEKNKEFLLFLKKIESKEILCSQLFLMGDMIDFISGESRYFIKQNYQVIELLNKLSKDIQIVYLEGNHDYNLKSIFPNINVIKRENQPLLAKLENNQTISLSHGDNFINWKYDLYCKIIRNTFFLQFMNLIDINFFISKKIENTLVNKNICHKMNNFKQIVEKRIKNYNTDIVIEGHYHQGDIYNINNKKYVNIPSLCCQKEYVKIKDLEFEKVNLCTLF
ncbi:MAG: metallophosphoesterase family protein [Aliarcobacter sp.]|jgi:UDP-2,3-diacylglucosamine hydrolase|nr:metallophosphoesterase family protein [Aliarcobacter sp.]MBP6714279.1 metallophosphoesterase family protein [Aliarcobacter sp.]MBP7227230.1 metallophosphoesterase family protein [Aliarcobacter sp.]MDX9961149.1 metallophosphoesterase family protein [Aliarcobacter sp.]